jgi:DNA-binding transcriptional ArsR family regulator
MEQPIILKTKKDLDVYINPRRQELLRVMQIENKPVTPKELSRKMGISSSSVQYHIQKLLGLGVIELHHTEIIRGITARFYWLPPRTVSLGRAPHSAENAQRLALMRNSLTSTFEGFSEYFTHCESPPEEAQGMMGWGIVHMEEGEIRALKRIIHNFIHEHEKPETKGVAMEYALLAYPIGEDVDA